MKNKLTLTVGIAAYNEEKNIINTVADVLKQTNDIWSLNEIIVYSDGSDDMTCEKLYKFNNKIITVLENKTRKGKAHGINQILKNSNSDIVVLFDADIRIRSTKTITNLIKAFEDKSVMLVGGNTRPFKPATFIEKAVYSTFLVFDDSRKYVKDGNNIFGCNGACVALTKKFAKQLHLPSIVNDDDYLYFSALKKKYTFKYVENAKVYYKLPNSIKDYLRQCFRSNPEAVVVNMSDYFGDVVKKEYQRPVLKYAKSIILQFVNYPLEVGFIILINVLIKPLYAKISRSYKLSWFTAVSTK